MRIGEGAALPRANFKESIAKVLESRGIALRPAPTKGMSRELPPISAFPDKFREYRSSRLWPFFEVRVPPTDRPDVKQVVSERGIDRDDVFRLLGELGRRSISSPYEFELAKA